MSRKIFRKFALLLVAVCIVQSSSSLEARDTEKHRVVWRDNPSTTAVVAWVQSSGSNPVVHFGDEDFGTNAAAYPSSQAPDRIETHFSLQHHFVRLSGLDPDTPYYYVIEDSEGVSQRYWFRTAPDVPSAFNFIAGGDSRNFREARLRANRMVAKLRPMFVMFNGDMTDGNSDEQWNIWLDDWELTTGSDGRMTPIIPARGNHEISNDDLYKVFDVNNPEAYFAHTIGGDQLRVYTLNTEISPAGDQQAWLENDLAAHSAVTFKAVQYHRATKPHTSSKGDRNSQYYSWANAFFDNGVDLVMEGDAHMVFETWPIKPSISGPDGFVRNDLEGTVYVGSGTWGAPLRPNDNDKAWTKASASFNQFKLVTVDSLGMQLRTILYDNEDLVAQVNDAAPFETPHYLKHWNPSTGPVITFGNPYTTIELAPAVNIDPSINDPIYFRMGDTVDLSGSVVVEGSIASVNYFMNGELISECSPTAPNFECSWMPPVGEHSVYLEATDDRGLPGRSLPILLTSENQLPNVAITSPSGGSTFDLGMQIMITAEASDIDGSIAKVEFFQDGSFISGCQDLSPPYVCIWTPSEIGIFEIFASTKDNDGETTVSSRIDIEIREPLADIVVYLAGPHIGGAMHTDLNAAGFLPLAQPYSASPFNYVGSETLTSIPSDMVDWVLVELRSDIMPSDVVGRRAGVLQSNGHITDLDGSVLLFPNLASGNYYIVVYHRNHLAIMSAFPQLFEGSVAYDFTEGLGKAFGTNAMRNIAGEFVMWGGDGNSSGDITSFDFLDEWLPINGGGAGYYGGDFNMNASPTALDFVEVWLPANGLKSQVPE